MLLFISLANLYNIVTVILGVIMKKLYLIIMLYVLSIGCYSVELHSKEDYGTVAIYRPMSIIGIAVGIDIMINQTIVGTIQSGEYIEFTLDPGEYLVHIASWSIHKNAVYEVVKLVVNSNERKNYSVQQIMYKPIKLKEITKELKLKKSDDVRWIKDEV